MAQPYVGEIRMFAGNFNPAGWLFCDGGVLPISENETLFQLIGTTYGGDGESTFGIPDLRGRVPIHQGTGPDGNTYTMAEAAGVESVTLTTQQTPVHSHPMLASGDLASTTSPTNNTVAANSSATTFPFGTDQPQGPLNAQSIGPQGGSQPHTNFQPYLGINFIISLFGIFPSPT